MNKKRQQLVEEAVDKALVHGRPFGDHWLYCMDAEQRILFADLRQFEEMCDVTYSQALS